MTTMRKNTKMPEVAIREEEAPVRPAPSRVSVDLLTTPDPETPWALWTPPSVVQCNLHEVEARVRGNEVVLSVGGEDIGVPSPGGLREMSTRVGFPPEFVVKLPPQLQADVLNDRIKNATDLRFSFTHRIREVAQNGLFVPDPEGIQLISNVSPGWRGVVASADIAQTVWALVKDVYGDGVEIRHAYNSENEMRLRVMTPYDEEIRPGGRALGDVLGLGIDVRYQAGMEIAISLFMERLVCDNGMTAAKSLFDWGSRAVGRAEDQLNWVTVGVANAVAQFDEVVARSQQMAGTPVDGDPEMALLERARAMRLPPRFDERLIEAYRQEPGADEWALLNAFTRLATHGGVPVKNADAIMAAAGSWATDFDICTARLPRPIAMNVGAHIINDGGLSL